jgi:hypothetical protein
MLFCKEYPILLLLLQFEDDRGLRCQLRLKNCLLLYIDVRAWKVHTVA